jgi:hypothetical protein
MTTDPSGSAAGLGRREATTVCLGAASVLVGYACGGLLAGAHAFAWTHAFVGATVGAMLLGHIALADRFRAFERAGGPRPSWFMRLLLWAVTVAETIGAFLLGRAAFWTWFAALGWSWLLYKDFFAPGLVGRSRALRRLARLVPFALLILVGVAAHS